MNSRDTLIKFSSILVYLIPFALLTGPFFPDLFLCLVSIIFIYITISEKSYSYYNNYFTYVFVLFCLYIIIRSLFSEYPFFSLKSSLVYFRFGIFSLAVWFIINNNKKFIKIFTLILMLTFVIAIIDGFFQYNNDFNIFGYYSPTQRMSLLLNDDFILGGFLARILPLLIALLIFQSKDNKINIYIILFLLVTTDIIIYLSGERTAFGLLLLSTILIILFVSSYRFLRLFTFILTLAAITLISITNEEVMDRNINQTISSMNLNNNSDEGLIAFTMVHQSHYLTAIKMFEQNKIFGVGPNLFRKNCGKENYASGVIFWACSTHPHNNHLQALAEIGILGFLFIILIIIYVSRKLINKLIFSHNNEDKLKSDYEVCLLICFAVSLFPFIPTQNLFNNWVNIIYYLPLGFYLHSIYNYKK